MVPQQCELRVTSSKASNIRAHKKVSLPSIRTRQRRHESNRLREKVCYGLTLGKLYSDEVRTPLLPSFNRCGAEGQPRHDGHASQEVFHVWKSKDMLIKTDAQLQR